MQFLSALLVLALPVLTNAEHIRQRGEDALQKRNRRRLNADAINSALAAAIPGLNEAIQANIEDPSKFVFSIKIHVLYTHFERDDLITRL